MKLSIKEYSLATIGLWAALSACGRRTEFDQTPTEGKEKTINAAPQDRIPSSEPQATRHREPAENLLQDETPPLNTQEENSQEQQQPETIPPQPAPPAPPPQVTYTYATTTGVFDGGVYSDGPLGQGHIYCNNFDQRNCRANYPQGYRLTVSVPRQVNFNHPQQGWVLATYSGMWQCNGIMVQGRRAGNMAVLDLVMNRHYQCGAHFTWMQ